MAVQLVTLIVGKRSRDNKWCHVKTLLDKFAEENTYKFYMNDENLQISMEEPSWVRYLKGTIKCFKAKRVNVPGFEIVIVSTVPVKCGLGSSSALVVAMYTFLEAITNTQTTNVLEKTLICYLAQRLASGCQHHRIADSLISIIGNEDKIIAFSSRSLTISNYDFSEAVDAEMVLIEFPNFDVGKSSKYRLDESRRKEILIIKNTKSRWRNNPEGASMMERLFSEETMTLTENILNEDKRTSQMIQAIQTKRWKKLGRMSNNCNCHTNCFVIFFFPLHSFNIV
ncbi:galactokinase isoform X2 [Halictus rubicundus]|uniref:galactokinase isoform X2 n=1 Tax=Halictus rubicundus TaxID=77578 RepID=UPI00403734A0